MNVAAEQVISHIPPALSDVREAWRVGRPILMGRPYGMGIIYAVHFPHLEQVKIGISKQPKRRLRQLSHEFGGPGFWFAAFRGSMADEAETHDRLARWRVSGELFRFEPVLIAAVHYHFIARGGRYRDPLQAAA